MCDGYVVRGEVGQKKGPNRVGLRSESGFHLTRNGGPQKAPHGPFGRGRAEKAELGWGQGYSSKERCHLRGTAFPGDSCKLFYLNSKNIQLRGDVPAKVCTALITDGKIIPPHLGNRFFNSKYNNFLSVPQSKVNYQGPSSKIWFTSSLLRIKKLEKLCYQYTICTQNKPFRKSRVWPAEGG